MTFSVDALARHHDRSRFRCGSDALDRYIREQASQDARRNVSRVFVAIPDNIQEVAAFYTLSAGSVERESLPEGLMKRLPRYPVPVALLGRLAVDRRWRGQGLGSAMLIDAIHRVRLASDTLGVYAIVVDAKDEVAYAFYKRFDFVEIPDSAMRLFLPMPTIDRLLKR